MADLGAILTAIVTPFDDGRRLHCVVTALVHVSFSGELLKDQELWFYATEETEGMVVDEGGPKPRGEWLVHGSCYARKPGVTARDFQAPATSSGWSAWSTAARSSSSNARVISATGCTRRSRRCSPPASAPIGSPGGRAR